MENKTLFRYIEGKASSKEKEEFASWIDSDEKNLQEFLFKRNIYDASLWGDSISQSKQGKQKTKAFRIVANLLKIASVFLLGIISYHYVTLYIESTTPQPIAPMQKIYVPEAQRAELILDDGTKVWLNGNSTFSFPKEFSKKERNVELQGEAFFEVTKDRNKPFIVNAGDYKIRVLGTEFNVKTNRDKKIFETSLLSGAVEIFSDDADNTIKLFPNERVYYANGQLIQSQIESHDKFLWREGLIVFEHESVKSILSQLENYYGVKIIVNNKKILNDFYTGKFRVKDGAEHVLKVLQLRHEFQYEKDYEKNIIIIN
ncbi:FecR family protein [Massilibacteroides sp.]|uniref:FecR family protein n=1 Tax=Massilibacteroides sp. TaxID=2034766 RepID=UPI00261994A5|nr:FecR family protein [Massilibacteroides sp.]MDD4516715.1 FecR family protein [Massilibacteroides sp.]